MNWLETLKSIAPTVASAFLGPLGGIAVSAVGNLLGVTDATQGKIAEAIQMGQMTPEQLSDIKQLEIKYQNDEKERGFRYADLEFRDRDSARKANVDGGTQKNVFWLSLILLTVTLGAEGVVLFKGIPSDTSELIVGRILGLLDSVALMVLSYTYGSNSGSARKTELLSQAPPVK